MPGFSPGLLNTEVFRQMVFRRYLHGDWKAKNRSGNRGRTLSAAGSHRIWYQPVSWTYLYTCAPNAEAIKLIAETDAKNLIFLSDRFSDNLLFFFQVRVLRLIIHAHGAAKKNESGSVIFRNFVRFIQTDIFVRNIPFSKKVLKKPRVSPGVCWNTAMFMVESLNLPGLPMDVYDTIIHRL